MGRVTLKASPDGLQKANAALCRFSSKTVLADLAKLSRTTVQAFFAGKPIGADSFRDICTVLDLPWKKIAGIETDVPFVTPTESAKTQGSESDPAITTKKASEICPYKGLSAFTTKDAAFFFGREKFTQTLVDAVQKRPFVAVIGNSGSGKSSVVYAGLIHQLEKQGGWKFIIFRPKKDPFFEMVNALSSLEDKLEDIKQAKKYIKDLKTGDLTLKDVFSFTLERKFPNDRFLIFVDQFEEVYTLCTEENERKNFIDQLLEVINAESETKSPNIVLVITLRADFYAQAIDYIPLGEILQKWNEKIILAMKPDELQAAIEKPAKVVGLTIQEGLTKTILNAVKSNPGELPLLEFCLKQLWEKQTNGQLTSAAYHEIGGVEKALANHAEENYHKLNGDEQNRVKHIFTQLVRFGENTEATRRIATREQIGAENWQLVTKKLADARLVVTGHDEDKKQLIVEVVHEALIRGWERLREWMEEYEEFRKWQDRLRAEKDIWEKSGKDHGALLRGALLVEAEEWLNKRSECIIDQEEREFILASRQYQEQEDIERIKELLNLSQKELQLKQQLSSLVIAVKAGVKLRNIKEPSEELKRNVVERLQQGSYEISEWNQLIAHKRSVIGIAISTGRQFIASASDDRTVKLWTLGGIILNTFIGHTDEVWGVSFSLDGQIIASASVDKTVRLWGVDGTLLRILKGHNASVYGVSFSLDGKMIASASADKTVRLWGVDGTLLRILEGHSDLVYGVSFSLDGKMIASASADKTVRLWGVDGTLLKILEGHSDRIWGVSFSSDSQMIASASADKTVRLWGVDGTLLKILEGHNDQVYGVNFSSDGQIIASASVDRTVRLWKLDGTILRTLEGHSDRVNGISFSADGQMIASASADRTVRLWRIDRKFLRTLEGHKDQVWGISFSPDGQMIASASLDKTVRIWAVDGTLLRILEGHSDRVNGVSFSPDSRMIVSASLDRTVRMWGLDGTLLRVLEGHSDRVWGISFSADGQMIASASADRTVRIWGLDGTLLRVLEGHSDQVWGVSFSPDGKIIASASLDRTVRIWGLDGTLLRVLEGHDDQVWGVSFSPDGKIIASASADKTVRLWNIDPEDLILDLDVKLNKLLKKGCNWIRDYLKTNPNVSENDRYICDGICSEDELKIDS